MYVVHLYFGERSWSLILSDGSSLLLRRPEKTVSSIYTRLNTDPDDSHKILFICLLLTGLSLLVRPIPPTTPSLADNIKSFLVSRLRLGRAAQSFLTKMISFLPFQVFPVLLLIRVPLLIVALQQQIFVHPTPPYLAANGQLRILSSIRSVSGQIVVAENLREGYRFLRVDHSILGGRWIRKVPNKNGTRTKIGDSCVCETKLRLMGQDLRDCPASGDWSSRP